MKPKPPSAETVPYSLEAPRLAVGAIIITVRFSISASRRSGVALFHSTSLSSTQDYFLSEPGPAPQTPRFHSGSMVAGAVARVPLLSSASPTLRPQNKVTPVSQAASTGMPSTATPSSAVGAAPSSSVRRRLQQPAFPPLPRVMELSAMQQWGIPPHRGL